MDLDGVDLDALGVALLGALINYRRSGWTMAADPLDVDRSRFLDAWVDQVRWTVAGLRVDGDPDATPSRAAD